MNLQRSNEVDNTCDGRLAEYGTSSRMKYRYFWRCLNSFKTQCVHFVIREFKHIQNNGTFHCVVLVEIWLIAITVSLDNTVYWIASKLLREILKQQNLRGQFALTSSTPNSGDSSPVLPWFTSMISDRLDTVMNECHDDFEPSELLKDMIHWVVCKNRRDRHECEI